MRPYSKKIPFYPNTLETTNNNVIPMLGLMWRCKATPCMNNISATENRKKELQFFFELLLTTKP